jgi:hypothetical protein
MSAWTDWGEAMVHERERERDCVHRLLLWSIRPAGTHKNRANFSTPPNKISQLNCSLCWNSGHKVDNWRSPICFCAKKGTIRVTLCRDRRSSLWHCAGIWGAAGHTIFEHCAVTFHFQKLMTTTAACFFLSLLWLQQLMWLSRHVVQKKTLHLLAVMVVFQILRVWVVWVAFCRSPHGRSPFGNSFPACFAC